MTACVCCQTQWNVYIYQLYHCFMRLSLQLHLGVESIRAPELLFQPSMIGSSEAGIIETIDFVLKLFTADEQQLLADNVFVTGGCARLPGLKARIERELMSIRPFQTTFKVIVAENSTQDAWNGARDMANATDFEQYLTTRNDYLEFGGEYFREHFACNRYFPTPAAIVAPAVPLDNSMIIQSQLSTSVTGLTSQETTKMEEEILVDDDMND